MHVTIKFLKFLNLLPDVIISREEGQLIFSPFGLSNTPDRVFVLIE